VILGQNLWPFEQLSLGSAKKYLSDYAVCIFVFTHLYAARYVNLSWILKLKKPIVLLASYTFTLYLVHAPVMKTVEHNMSINTDSIYTSLAVILLVSLATWALGLLTEQRKHKFKPLIRQVLGGVKKAIKTVPAINITLKPNGSLK
jgi:peptidoglycan/LPS O-acetylase OafA/YrhL